MIDQPTLPGITSASLPDSFFEPDERHGFFTAERFESRRPDDAKIALQLLGENVAVSRIAEMFERSGRGVSRNTLAALRDKHAGSVEQRKESTKLRLAKLRDMLCDRLEEIMDQLEPRDVPIAIGILTQREQEITGSVNLTININTGGERQALDAMLTEARRRMGGRAEGMAQTRGAVTLDVLGVATRTSDNVSDDTTADAQ